MTDTSPQLFERAGEGFFWCAHCSHVIDLPPEAEVNQNYKCTRCRHWTVRWKFPAVRSGRVIHPAPIESALAGFAAMRAAVEVAS